MPNVAETNEIKAALDDTEFAPDKQIIVSGEQILQEYTCERCGYHYKKTADFQPHLCYRCMRFIAKKVFVVMNTIQPATSRPVVGDI